MKIKLLPLVLSMLFISVCGWSQSSPGEVSGRITDAQTGEPIMFANVVAELNGAQKGGSATDVEGYYTIKPLTPGSYTIRVTYVGYRPFESRNVIVNAGRITKVDIKMTSSATQLTTVDFVEYVKPLIELDETTQGETITKEEIKALPTRSVNQAAAIAGGVYSKDGGTPNIKGARTDATEYYIDGMKVRGRLSMPQNAIEQLQVITGGVPAEYGDAIGGIISITTRGPSTRFGGGLELISSEMFDPYGYNLLEANVTGPLIVKDKDDRRDSVMLGYFLAGNVSRTRDNDPSAIGIYTIKDDVLDEIQRNPIRPAPGGIGFVPASEFLTQDDFELGKIKPNTDEINFNLSGKLDFQPVKNFNVTAGGQFGYRNYNEYIYSYSLVNSSNNPQVIRSNYRGYLRFGQNFDYDSASTIKNAYYSVQVDYSKQYFTRQDDTHKDNVFDYGYLGSFETYRAPFYALDTIVVNGQKTYTNVLQGYQDTLVKFTPAGLNPTTENYTKQFFDLQDGDVSSLNEVVAFGGLRNGDAPRIIYSLWNNSGAQYPNYQKLEEDQFNLFATASGNVGNHAIKFGVQFEQRVERSYGINATGLWTQMRQLMNSHLSQLDTANPVGRYRDEVFQDTVDFLPFDESVTNPDAQSDFDRNFRQSLIDRGATDIYGNPITERSIINIDRYSPADYSLDMFSADDLLSQGNSLVAYYGYDYKGDKLKGRPSLADFVDDERRLLAPYNPIYVAGYIEDKFAFRDLIFRVGVRVDRFDANQPVLKDPYSLYPIRTAGEISDNYNHPGNIGSDFKVYVNDLSSPSPQIVGYRDGDTWYDETGAEINDPNNIALSTTTGTIQPYLLNTEEELTTESFEDYQPQVSVMPRVSFSFPISDQASFFANYDVLTQRPRTYNIGGIEDYFFLESRSTRRINNPALRPEKRINYELGFKQKLSVNTALTLQAFYGEIRDMVQVVRVVQAYPIEYTSYGNIDFGTVKGFAAKYDLRKLPGSNVSLNFNYTLQFADGTGSSATSGANFANLGLPGLRIPVPLSYDVRHNIAAVVDYRYLDGPRYNGPVWVRGEKDGTNPAAEADDKKDIPLLENMGFNLLINARSGEPYTQQENVTQAVAIGVAQRRALSGNINGSRLPWQFRADLKVDRNFLLGTNRDDSEVSAYRQNNPMTLNVYIWVSNLLNSLNVVNVYAYTGSPDDDGFLASVEGRQTAANATSTEAYVDQYSLKVDNPANYAQPRFIRLGAIFNF
ncbi:MAG: TonB-dependent receptor [Bacteroidia bacterium]